MFFSVNSTAPAPCATTESCWLFPGGVWWNCVQFLKREEENRVRYSVISGKKIKMKVDKSEEDRVAEANRNQLLQFLNSSYD